MLARHFAEGRLSSEELDIRLADAIHATTRGDLDRLVRDLPALTSPVGVRAIASSHSNAALMVFEVLLALLAVAAAVCMVGMTAILIMSSGAGYFMAFFLGALGAGTIGVAGTHFIHRYLRRRGANQPKG